VSTISGQKNWRADDYGIPTHITGGFDKDSQGRTVYRILIDADEEDDTANPFGRDHLTDGNGNVNCYYFLEVFLTITYFDVPR